MTLAKQALDEGDVARISYKTAELLRLEEPQANQVEILKLETIAQSLKSNIEARKELAECPGISEDDSYDRLVCAYYR